MKVRSGTSNTDRSIFGAGLLLFELNDDIFTLLFSSGISRPSLGDSFLLSSYSLMALFHHACSSSLQLWLMP